MCVRCAWYSLGRLLEVPGACTRGYAVLWEVFEVSRRVRVYAWLVVDVSFEGPKSQRVPLAEEVSGGSLLDVQGGEGFFGNYPHTVLFC